MNNENWLSKQVDQRYKTTCTNLATLVSTVCAMVCSQGFDLLNFGFDRWWLIFLPTKESQSNSLIKF